VKQMELRVLLCARCLLAVEKHGTVWVESNGIETPRKAKNASKMLALRGSKHNAT
jgi:hypothetical protein